MEIRSRILPVSLMPLRSRSILPSGNFVAIAATLRCKVRTDAQVLDPAQQKLELSESSGGSVLRYLECELAGWSLRESFIKNASHHMPGKLDGHVGEPTLSVPFAEVAGAAQSSEVQLLMVWNKEVVGRIAAESLGAVPRHVLDGHQRAICQQDEIKQTMADDSALILFNDTGKNAESRWWRRVVIKNAVAALLPLLDGSIDSTLDVGAVEVDRSTLRQIPKATGEAEYVPK